MKYCSVSDKAREWNISVQRIRYLCKEKRIPGVMLVGHSYLIPEEAGKPPDNRKKRNKTNRKKAIVHENLENLQIIRECYELSPDLYYLVSKDTGQIIYINRKAREEYGIHIPFSWENKMKPEVFYDENTEKYYDISVKSLQLGMENFLSIIGRDITKLKIIEKKLACLEGDSK